MKQVQLIVAALLVALNLAPVQVLAQTNTSDTARTSVVKRRGTAAKEAKESRTRKKVTLRKRVVQQPVVQPVKDAQMAWDFTSALWTGYEQYHRAFNDYPDIKWFDNIVKYNLPIYLNEFGFSLDSGKQNFFVWDNLSADWKNFYSNNFAWSRENDGIKIRFELPSAVVTPQHGELAAGVYYYTTAKGLQSEKDFQKGTGTYEPTLEEKQADAKRVFETALAVSKALEKFRDDQRYYPVTFETAIELGENGNTALCMYGGFTCQGPSGVQNKTYISDIKSGRPSTKLMYDSRYDGKGYVISFTIYGKYDQYEPGKYEIGPYSIVKVADLTSAK